MNVESIHEKILKNLSLVKDTLVMFLNLCDNIDNDEYIVANGCAQNNMTSGEQNNISKEQNNTPKEPNNTPKRGPKKGQRKKAQINNNTVLTGKTLAGRHSIALIGNNKQEIIDEINVLLKECEQIRDQYFIVNITQIIGYYKSNRTSIKINEDYCRNISKFNSFEKTGKLVKKISDLIIKVEKMLPNNQQNYSRLSIIKCSLFSIKIDGVSFDNYVVADICCDQQMTVLMETSEMICHNCYKVKKLDGVVFKNDQFYPQDGHKTKHGTYDSMRHYKFWIDHIQGKETQVFSEEFLLKLNNLLAVSQPNKKLITYGQVRKALKYSTIKAMRLNDHVSLLLKLIGAQTCPQLSYEENIEVSFMFSRVMCLYKELKLPNKNKPYYPYFIYKIIEAKFWNSPKLRILNYIHLQAVNTTIKNDNIFKKICEISEPADGLVYKPTDANLSTLRINHLCS
jgi:hypothetical protein